MTNVCSEAYPNFSTDTLLSLTLDHFISALTDTTTRYYLFHDRACHALTWQETVQMAQACDALLLSLHASPVAAAVANTMVGAPSLDECMRAFAKNTVAPMWQQSARDWEVKSATHLSRKFSSENSPSHANKSKGPSTAQQNSLPSTKREPPPYSKSPSNNNSLVKTENFVTQNSFRHRAVKCFKCGKSGHIASACAGDAKSVLKCFGCNSVGQMVCNCPTHAAQAAEQANATS